MDKVTIVVVTFNHERYVRKLLDSLQDLEYADYEIIVVDNASRDKSADIVEQEFPKVSLVRSKDNTGPYKPFNSIMRSTDSRFVAILGPDTWVDRQWLKELVRGLVSDENAICSFSTVLGYDPPHILQSTSCAINFVGQLTYRTALAGDGHVLQSAEIEETDGSSSTGMLLERKKFLDMGGFDEDYFVYGGDVEAGLRARLLGYKCLYVPAAKIYHGSGTQEVSYRGESGRYPPKKAFWTTQGRLMMIIKDYSLRTIVLVAPALLVFELSAIVFYAVNGVLRDYFHAWSDVIGRLGDLREKRADIQRRRKLLDKCILSAEPLTLANEQRMAGSGISSLIKGFIDRFLRIYWSLVKYLV